MFLVLISLAIMFPLSESFSMLVWLLMPEVTEKKTDKIHCASLKFEAESCVPEVILCTIPAAF